MKVDDILRRNCILFFSMQSSLYFKCAPKKQCELLELDADTLTVKGIAVLEGRDWPSSVMFSDGDNLGMITAGKDVSFVYLITVIIK